MKEFIEARLQPFHLPKRTTAITKVSDRSAAAPASKEQMTASIRTLTPVLAAGTILPPLAAWEEVTHRRLLDAGTREIVENWIDVRSTPTDRLHLALSEYNRPPTVFELEYRLYSDLHAENQEVLDEEQGTALRGTVAGCGGLAKLPQRPAHRAPP